MLWELLTLGKSRTFYCEFYDLNSFFHSRARFYFLSINYFSNFNEGPTENCHGKLGSLSKYYLLFYYHYYCERFEPRSHFKRRLSLIVRVNVVLNRTVIVNSDWRFDNLCGSHFRSQSELYHISWWYYTLVINLIGQLRCNVIAVISQLSRDVISLLHSRF